MERITGLEQAFFDPNRTFLENATEGPFGEGRGSERYMTPGEPIMKFFGQDVFVDFGVPAGPLPNGRSVKRALDLGFGYATYKTVRSEEHPVNGFYNFFGTELDQMYTSEVAEKGVRISRSFSFPSSPTNSFGVPCFDESIWLPDATDAVAYARKGQVVVISFQGTSKGDGDIEVFIKDNVQAAKLAKSTGAKILELNGSCVNEGNTNLLCLDYRTSARVVEAIRNEIGDTKLLMKLCYFSDQELLQNFLKWVGPHLDGVTVINTMSAKIIDEDGSPAFGANRERAGISGIYIRPYMFDMVARVIRIADGLNLDLGVNAVGGICDFNDYQAVKELGESLTTGRSRVQGVGVATAFLAKPRIANEIKAGLGISVVRVDE